MQLSRVNTRIRLVKVERMLVWNGRHTCNRRLWDSTGTCCLRYKLTIDGIVLQACTVQCALESPRTIDPLPLSSPTRSTSVAKCETLSISAENWPPPLQRHNEGLPPHTLWNGFQLLKSLCIASFGIYSDTLLNVQQCKPSVLASRSSFQAVGSAGAKAYPTRGVNLGHPCASTFNKSSETHDSTVKQKQRQLARLTAALHLVN